MTKTSAETALRATPGMLEQTSSSRLDKCRLSEDRPIPGMNNQRGQARYTCGLPTLVSNRTNPCETNQLVELPRKHTAKNMTVRKEQSSQATTPCLRGWMDPGYERARSLTDSSADFYIKNLTGTERNEG